MHFRLVYRGTLHGGEHSSATALKHRIRRKFHPQLRELWRRHRFLQQAAEEVAPNKNTGNPENTLQRFANYYGFPSQGKPYRVVPLIGDCTGTSASLDVLYLRYGHPGDLIKADGDIDNRMKVLFDALSMPENKSGIDEPTEDDDPFYVLLRNDKFVDELTVTTDRLLEPLDVDRDRDYAELVITVKTTVFDPNPARFGFYGR